MAELSKQAKNQLVKRFLISALLLFIVWQLAYNLVLKPNGSLDEALTSIVVKGTELGMKIFNSNSEARGNIIYINGNAAIRVEHVCNGLELMVLYVCFFLCIPGRIRPKMSYIILGLFIVFVLNTIRQMLLAYNYLYFNSTFEFNHKYTYIAVIYFAVFLLWRHWLIRYSIIAENRNK
ncbi:archaeosortase/exosortase family protein [Aegicerativicinus sediminis]|uniref:archaeosortase/exosortase family protein n=1 Tax=Aegicerativicinus sediminis TaxID=2893202 RepID=UPI001E62393B|nr:archaeosortase/exosortase family protein [Aegicerativicinus sediminis]